MINKKIGNTTEQEFCKLMHSKGWWITILADKANGQPFDFIMSKDEITYFGDVKHIEKGLRFPISRIEDNQYNSMRMLQNCGTNNTIFACYFKEKDEFRFFKYKQIYKTNFVVSIHYNEMNPLEELL